MSVSAIRVPFITPFLDYWTNNVNKYFYDHRLQRNCCSRTRLNSPPSYYQIPNPRPISTVDSICCPPRKPRKLKKTASYSKLSQSCSCISTGSQCTSSNVSKLQRTKNNPTVSSLPQDCDTTNTHDHSHNKYRGDSGHDISFYRSLGKHPCRLKCPFCGKQTITRVTYLPTRATDYYAILLLPLFLCFLPYMMKGTKMAKHDCCLCGKTIGIE